MKKNVLLIVFIGSSILSFSQNSEWTKDDRNNVYNEYLDALVKYKSISNDQRESVSLCCLEEVTEKYTKKEYLAKIDIEIKRIQEAMITQCSKNLGVDLVDTKTKVEAPTVKVETGIFKKEDFNGSWTCENGVYTFYSVDGEFKLKSPSYSSEARGKWYLDNKTLILEDTKTFWGWGSAKFEVVSVTVDEILLIGAGQTFHLKKNE